MRLHFIYASKFLGRPLDLANLYTSDRGLTGAELSFFEYARAMADRGHEVAVGIGGRPGGAEPDVAISWMDPDMLQGYSPSTLRVVNQQLNDWAYCRPGFNSYVDVVTSPHPVHRDYMVPITEVLHSKWEVLPNGCDPSQYDDGPRVPGRVIYASCPSRGLHHVLAMWPEIRRQVPHAHLRIFYEVRRWIEGVLASPPDDEQVRRARLLNETLDQPGVELVGPSSRERMAREFSEAEVLAYPVDTVRFTEGFSVTTMEACASGCVPVIRPVDVMGQLYYGMPMAESVQVWAQLVVRALTDADFRARARERGREIAEQHTWPLLAERLEQILQRRLARG